MDPDRSNPMVLLMLRVGVLIFGFLGTTAGCMVGPDYQPPEVSPADHWHVELVEGLEAEPRQATGWWRAFNDPVLDELIVLAQTRNHTLAVAALRIDVARAKHGIAASDLWPTVRAVGMAHKRDTPTRRPFVSDIIPNSDYIAALDVSWEVDLWGRVRRGMEAAEANVEQTVENWRDLLVMMRAEVATSYVAARTLQAEAAALRESIRSHRRLVALQEEMAAAGAIADTQLANAKARLHALQAQLPGVEAGIAQAINRISVLIGERPGPLRQWLCEPALIPVPPRQIAVGIPGDVIRQRPDIRAAERRVALQTARIGVATASLLPRLSINGVLGFESDSFSGWMDGDNLSAGIGPRIVWPVFNGWAILKDIEITDLRTEQAMIEYEQTVLRAFEEAENALIAYANALKSQHHLGRSVDEYEAVYVLAEQRFDAGAENLQDFLRTEQSLLDSRMQWIEARGTSAANLVALYKALGGDWELPPGPFPPGEEDLEKRQEKKGQPEDVRVTATEIGDPQP